jgi:hypothetical protein
MHPKEYKFQWRGPASQPGNRARSMFDVGYFPPNTPPDEWISFNGISPS